MADIYTFTPRLKTTGERLTLALGYEDHCRIQSGRPWSAQVMDIATGQVYRAEGAECGIPRCYCDAVVTPVNSVLDRAMEILTREVAPE